MKKKMSFFFRRMRQSMLGSNSIITQQSIRHTSRRGTVEPNEEPLDFDPNKPIPYFSSGLYKTEGIHYDHKAAAKSTDYNRSLIAMGSVALFMFYFCILRGENDVDDELSRDFFHQFGEEAAELKKTYEHNVKHNLPVTDILDRFDALGIPRTFQPQRVYDSTTYMKSNKH